ncbi:MAG: Do family serine endopeptidase [Rhodothermaceae bacterium TMED105]|nr:MAG: Do family serine endopeptidase [Rhodothermaceae bacterium TMED105]
MPFTLMSFMLKSIQVIMFKKSLMILSIFAAGFALSAGTATGQSTDPATAQSSLRNASLAAFNNAIVDIADQTNPTVVTVRTAQTVRYRQMDPFAMFFGEPGNGQVRERVRRGLGSGVIVSDQGVILTNYHVIEDATEIIIDTYDGNEYTAEVVGTDPMMDIAVLRVGVEGLPSIRLGDSDDARVGELVLAVGSPLDESLAHSVSMGIISAKGRSIGIYENVAGYENFIQTDAAINPGNSGGALVNMDGELIGINSAIASRSGGNQGIGFAIPINMARQAMESILREGRVVRGYLGITWGGDVDQTMARALKLNQPNGIIIGSVQRGGPADKAGLESEDVIVAIDNEPIREWAQLRTKIASTPPGETIQLQVVRDGREREVRVKLEALDSNQVASATPDGGGSSDDTDGAGGRDAELDAEARSLVEDLGLSLTDLSDLTEELRARARVGEDVEGVLVTSVTETSKTYRQGLRPGDVITQIQGEAVNSPETAGRVLLSLNQRGEEAILLRIQRQGQRLFIAIDF